LTQYLQHKAPRRINLVTIFFFLAGVAAVYAAWKFVPPYWTRYKVDSVLGDLAAEATNFHQFDSHARSTVEKRVVDRGLERLYELGLEDHPGQPVDIGITSDLDAIYARWRVIVNHPFGVKPTILDFYRERRL
jgi:hypothetical protein